MAKLTTIASSSGSVIRKEHRSHFGISDPECRVMEEAGTTEPVEPLLANFSPEHFSTASGKFLLRFSSTTYGILNDCALTTYHYSNIKERHSSSCNDLKKPNRLRIKYPIQGLAYTYLLFACSSKLLSK